MRVYALYLLVACLSLYAYRDWFKSLCGLILLMAVIEHSDMPKSIMGIQGFAFVRCSTVAFDASLD